MNDIQRMDNRAKEKQKTRERREKDIDRLQIDIENMLQRCE